MLMGWLCSFYFLLISALILRLVLLVVGPFRVHLWRLIFRSGGMVLSGYFGVFPGSVWERGYCRNPLSFVWNLMRIPLQPYVHVGK